MIGTPTGVRKLVERDGHAAPLQVFRTLGELRRAINALDQSATHLSAVMP